MIRPYVAPVVLVVVALAQRYLMRQQHLDAWKGGGFGMFSAVSASDLRRMTVTLITEDGQEKRFPPAEVVTRIPLNGDMPWHRSRVLTMPHPALLRRLAERLAKARWVAVRAQAPPAGLPSREAHGGNRPGPGEPRPGPAGVEYYRMAQDVRDGVATRALRLKGVRVEVWEYQLDRAANRLVLTKLADATARPG